MGLPVSLKAVVTELDTVSDEMSAYIHRETGELYTLTGEDIAYAEGDHDEEDAPDWQQESIAKAKEILESDAWLSLPGKFDINEWEIMRDFAQSQADERVAGRLLRAIQGKGAFRYFKDVLIEEGIRDAWFAFRDQAFEQIAEEFLVEAKIPFKREPESRERADVGPLAGRRKLAIVGEIRSLADRLAGSKSIDPIAGANRGGS